MSAALSEQPAGEQAFSDPAKGKGRRLTKREIATCLQLFDAGKSGADIAKLLRCHESTVSRTLDAWADDRPLARRYLESNSLKMAKTIVQSKHAPTVLDALGKVDVVRDSHERGGLNIAIAIGQPGQALSAPDIRIQALSPPTHNDLACGNASQVEQQGRINSDYVNQPDRENC